MTSQRMGRKTKWLIGLIVLISGLMLWLVIGADAFDQQFDADYVGSEVCGDCHSLTYDAWITSPHRNIVRPAASDTVIGNFTEGVWRLPADGMDPHAGSIAARMYQKDGQYIMAIRNPGEQSYAEFPIEMVVGYQYRQEYLTREEGGVLRRLPLQWSTARNEFFPYWNEQEHSEPSVNDLWVQMQVQNSAWNLFCARCHTTHLEIHEKDEAHTRAVVTWTETGIACEACHGPGSLHVDYMDSSWTNRLAMYVRGKFQGQPVAYMASAAKLPKGQALSVCGRCHGADIFSGNQDIYRQFEPGYSREGRINDLSAFFRQAPLTPGRTTPTVEVWQHGKPKGIGMLFRSLVESSCYQQAGVRCQDCHNPHNNKLPASPGLLHSSSASNDWCMECHQSIDPAAHSQHQVGEAGSYCYDCHMPKHIQKFARGIEEYARTHEMSSIPDPRSTLRFGPEGAPNACNDCHQDEDANWALEQMESWWPGSTGSSPRASAAM